MTEKIATSSPELWELEYERRGIPSSFRDEPSGAVELFLEFLTGQGLEFGKGLDIGSGTGRNSIFLCKRGYEMTAMDYVGSLVEALEREAQVLGIQLNAVCHNVNRVWPFSDASFDFAIDAFCFKHQIAEEDIELYTSEISRVIRRGGFFMLSLAGVDDGYYRNFVKSETDFGDGIIVDPENGIASVLYDRAGVERRFGDYFNVSYHENKVKSSLMHGDTYQRSTHVFFFQRK